MRAKELRDLSDDQLVEQVRNAREETFNLRFQAATGELENTSRPAIARREVARALTIASERDIDIERELAT